MKPRRTRRLLATAAGLIALFTAVSGQASVPVRISVKFMLDAQGNRGSGDVNTNQDVADQIDRSNEILRDMGSEFRVEVTEIVDIDLGGTWHSQPVGGASRNMIRSAALADPAGFAWRTDAVNFYVSHDTGSAIADFPSDNNIVMVGQGIFATTFLHELGHILDLRHTHETDYCNDTIADDSDWKSWQAVADGNFGAGAMLTLVQEAQVNAVWNNVMSYHDGDNRSFFTGCQMDRESSMAWQDRNWLLGRIPLYVHPDALPGGMNGSWASPLATVDEAIAQGNALSGRVLVLIAGQHTLAGGTLTSTDLEVVSRRGSATIRKDESPWDGRVDPAASQDPDLVAAMAVVQAADRARDEAAAMDALHAAEQVATGADRIAIQLELGQRMRQQGDFAEAIVVYERVVEAADEVKLRRHAEHWIERSRAGLRSARERESGRGIDPSSGGARGGAVSGSPETAVASTALEASRGATRTPDSDEDIVEARRRSTVDWSAGQRGTELRPRSEPQPSSSASQADGDSHAVAASGTDGGWGPRLSGLGIVLGFVGIAAGVGMRRRRRDR